MFKDLVQNIVAQYPDEAIFAGEKLDAKQVLELSSLFTQLELSEEDIHLVILDKNSKPLIIITDLNVLYLDNKISKAIKIAEYSSELLKSIVSVTQIEIIDKTVQLISTKKNEHRKTLDSFVDKLKTIVNTDKQNFNNSELFFDGKYLEMLLQESDELINLCNKLNQDALFIQSVNLIFDGANQALSEYKAEHLLLHDLIKAYKDVIQNENEKTRFTLAYFFERLNGKDFSKGISIQRLNDMSTKQFFVENVEKIKSAKIVTLSKGYENEYILPTILNKTAHELFLKTGNLIYRFASIVAKADDKITEKEKQALRIVLEKTAKPNSSNDKDKLKKDIPEGDTLEAVLSELNSLIGLEEVKNSITDLINFLKIQKIRQEKGLENVQTSLHAVFLGPPGTGKTTIARLIGRIYKHLGFLDKGHIVETDRAGMVAGYVGQTAIKVDELVNNSLDGVLFIDEAYSLNVDNGEKDFGNEAIDTLVKRMEDFRDKLVVIIAGYTEPMKILIESNNGLRSRFSRYFVFQHFLPTQLLEIMKSYCEKADFKLTPDASDKLLDTFELLYEKKDDSFGNARVVRNLFEKCIQNQANRLVSVNELTNELLQTIESDDIPEPKDTVNLVYLTQETN